MNVIESELIVGIDVDGTLIVPDPKGSLQLAYGSSIQSFKPIIAHVDLLKEYKKRGFYVIVWSAGGYKWALQAVQALKLERFVDQILSKPIRHVDDKEDIASIVGTRVFIA